MMNVLVERREEIDRELGNAVSNEKLMAIQRHLEFMESTGPALSFSSSSQ